MTTSPLVIHESGTHAAQMPGMDYAPAQSEEMQAGVSEISPGAWKVILLLLGGSVVFLAAVGAYVLSGMSRFQDCL